MKARWDGIRSSILLSVLCGGVLSGCSKPAEETASTPTTPNTTAPAVTSSQMPPEARARMEATQQAMKERTEAQGRAMMQQTQGR